MFRGVDRVCWGSVRDREENRRSGSTDPVTRSHTNDLPMFRGVDRVCWGHREMRTVPRSTRESQADSQMDTVTE
jgi:hypothetical protein